MLVKGATAGKLVTKSSPVWCGPSFPNDTVYSRRFLMRQYKNSWILGMTSCDVCTWFVFLLLFVLMISVYIFAIGPFPWKKGDRRPMSVSILDMRKMDQCHTTTSCGSCAQLLLVNIMASYAFTTQGARPSTDMVLATYCTLLGIYSTMCNVCRLVAIWQLK